MVIDRFIGEDNDVYAPEWLQSQRLRSLMLDLLLYFAADLLENHQLYSGIENWCKAVSVSSFLHLRGVVITYHLGKCSCIWYNNSYPLPCARQLPLSLRYL